MPRVSTVEDVNNSVIVDICICRVCYGFVFQQEFLQHYKVCNSYVCIVIHIACTHFFGSKPSGRRIPDGKIYGGLDLDGMLDVYCYDGVTYGELCGRYVRRSAVYPASEPAVRMLDPGMTDKFEMWRMVDGGTVSLSGRSAVAVVVEGDGMLNGCSVRKGDRLLVYAERELAVKGKAVVLVCK